MIGSALSECNNNSANPNWLNYDLFINGKSSITNREPEAIYHRGLPACIIRQRHLHPENSTRYQSSPCRDPWHRGLQLTIIDIIEIYLNGTSRQSLTVQRDKVGNMYVWLCLTRSSRRIGTNSRTNNISDWIFNQLCGQITVIPTTTHPKDYWDS